MTIQLSELFGLSVDDLAAKVPDLDQARTLRAEAVTSVRAISTDDAGRTRELAGDDAQRFDQTATLADRLGEVVRRHEMDRLQRFCRGEHVPDLMIDHSSVMKRQEHHNVRDAAMRSLDAAVASKRLNEDGAELVETLMRTGPEPAQSWTRRWAEHAGNPDYERAFSKLLANPDRGHLTWTPAEADAYRRVEALATEQRAMSLTGASGGHMVPMHLDPAVILTSNGSRNPLRQICRVVQIAGSSWNGVTSAGVTAEWKAEAAEVADASPTLAQPNIPVHLGDAYVPYSFELEGDAANLMGELGKLLADSADQLTATAYTTGTGSGQPKGIITALSVVAGSKVDPGIAETIAASDIYKVAAALPPRFQPNAAWSASLPVLNALRQFETGNGALTFPGLQDANPTLLGRAVHENSNMGGLPNPGATAQNYPLLYGDFANGMVIVDRIGATLETIQHVVGPNNRPTGQRGALLWFRTGSDVVNPNALRTLAVPTTA